AGTCAAIAAFSLAALVVAAVEELFLLLPQPAIAAIASSATPTRTGLLIETSCGGVEVRPAVGDRRPRKYKRAAYRLFTVSPKDLPALRTALRSRSYCVCTSRSAISSAESTIS